MRISYKQLKSLTVETVSGTKLGHVHDLILDTDGQLVAQYDVKSAIIAGKEYLVGRDQVVSITADKLIVDDTIRPAVAESVEKRELGISPDPVAMRKG